MTYRIERANESLGPARLAGLSPFAIERQRHRKARPLADPAPDGKVCGRCDSCLLRAKGFSENNMADPAVAMKEAV